MVKDTLILVAILLAGIAGGYLLRDSFTQWYNKLTQKSICRITQEPLECREDNYYKE